MLEVQMTDVLTAIYSCRVYLALIAAALVAAIVIAVAVRKRGVPEKFLIRCQCLAVALAIIVGSLSAACVGPLHSLLNLVGASRGSITEESNDAAMELVNQIVEEGTVLLKNENSLLPLESGSNINVFGWSSTNPAYGGTGAGSLTDIYPIVDLLDGLESEGFSYNTELSDFYKAYASERPSLSNTEQDWTLPEPPVDQYTEEMIENAKAFSDVAMMVITRVGGENYDLPEDMSAEGLTYNENSTEYEDFPEGTHYLELSQSEKNLLELLDENFEHIIFVYNGSNAFELGALDEYEHVESILWAQGTGQNGFEGFARILNGEANPSAKTSDTFVADLTATPTYNNFGLFVYDNMDDYISNDYTPSFINYVEGIYVGYKFYETAAEEGLIDYDEAVTYPFGYGLSYTTFEQEMGDLTVDGSTLSVDVTVTNTGSVAGKEVVELYYTPPYYNGGIEKSSVNLLTFGKTEELEPGESETLSFSFDLEEMASYDTYGEGCYVLEEGDYIISVRSDSHTVIDERTYTLDQDIVYDEDNKRDSDETAAVNQFDFAEGDIEYLSRADGFANYESATAAPTDYSMAEEAEALFVNWTNYESTDYDDPDDEMPTMGADNGLVLADLRGADYDDPLWEDLLDQMSFDDMDTLIALAGSQTQAIESVGKADTYDTDGPLAIHDWFANLSTVGFPTSVTMACTWNEELLLEFGRSVSEMAKEIDISGWYGPAMNTHRSAFAGRNFEYYSEDGVLAGKLAAKAVAGAAENGVYAYIKHFALNELETHRQQMLCTWANEQSIREIYLKPFEYAVKEGGATAVMSSFNYIGSVPAAGCSALLNTVLRDEWGFEGMVLTDWFGGYGYQIADEFVRAGNDAMLANMEVGTDTLYNHIQNESATMVIAMRQACKNIMYTIVNSWVYENGDPDAALMLWQIIMYVVDAAAAATVIAIEVIAVRGYKKRKTRAQVIPDEEQKEGQKE